MNSVPYALNQVLLYGGVAGVEQEMSEQGALVILLLRCQRTEEPHPVELRDRRALEFLAYHQAQREMYPKETFLASVTGSLRTRQRKTVVEADSVTFHIPADVRAWGNQAVRLTFKRYAQLYGYKPWLHIDPPSSDLNPELQPEEVAAPAPGHKRRAPAKAGR